MQQDTLQNILKLITSLSDLQQSATALKSTPVIGDVVNKISPQLASVGASVSQVRDLLKNLEPIISMIPDVPGDWDDQIKKAIKSLESTGSNVSQSSQDSTVVNSESQKMQDKSNPLSGVNLNDGLGMDDVMSVLGNLNN